MIEINITDLIKSAQKVLVHRKGQAPFYQERGKSDKLKDKKKRKSDRDKVTIQGKTLEERKKEAEERAKKDKVAEYIWERRMEGKKDDGGAKRE